MIRSRLPVLLLLLALAGQAPALAWAPETRVQMAEKAVRLMPASLRLALERYREPLLRGLLAPQVEETGDEHQPPWNGGSLDREIEARALDLIRSVEQAAPFTEIASKFGALAHFVMDAGFPPGMTRGAERRYAHFSDFCESKRDKFPLVFYGHDDPALEDGSYRDFAMTVLERAKAEDLELARAYDAAGEPPNPAAFDDRSVPFAVGSLSYSHTVTDIARIWISAWRDAYGDTSRTPYLESK